MEFWTNCASRELSSKKIEQVWNIDVDGAGTLIGHAPRHVVAELLYRVANFPLHINLLEFHLQDTSGHLARLADCQVACIGGHLDNAFHILSIAGMDFVADLRGIELRHGQIEDGLQVDAEEIVAAREQLGWEQFANVFNFARYH